MRQNNLILQNTKQAAINVNKKFNSVVAGSHFMKVFIMPFLQIFMLWLCCSWQPCASVAVTLGKERKLSFGPTPVQS